MHLVGADENGGGSFDHPGSRADCPLIVQSALHHGQDATRGVRPDQFSAVNVVEAEAHLGVALPQALRGLYSSGDGRFREDGQWWVVWPLDQVVDRNLAAWSDGTLAKELLAFGDDGTGNPFCVDATGHDPAVVRWSWIDGDLDMLVGPMTTFAEQWLDEPSETK
jgi:hypothetical protein